MSKAALLSGSGSVLVIISAMNREDPLFAFGVLLLGLGFAFAHVSRRELEGRIEQLERTIDELRRRVIATGPARRAPEVQAAPAGEPAVASPRTGDIAHPGAAGVRQVDAVPPGPKIPIRDTDAPAGNQGRDAAVGLGPVIERPLASPAPLAQPSMPPPPVAAKEIETRGPGPLDDAGPVGSDLGLPPTAETEPAAAEEPAAAADGPAGIAARETLDAGTEAAAVATPHPPAIVSPLVARVPGSPSGNVAPPASPSRPPVPPRPVAAPSPAAKAAPPPPARSLLDFEQILGVNWLSKVGVAILVIGLSFFLAWQLRQMGPVGKDVVGVVVALAMLGAGLWGERSERYRILSRASIAGGWALLFFVSYAAHHVQAARVIESPVAALLLMLGVGAAMVVHTLRYRSQVVTGLAFLLAFATIALNRADVTSLAANVVLAAGLSFVVVRMRWFELEAAGIAATYANHYLFLRPLIDPERGPLLSSNDLHLGATFLVVYWIVFRAAFAVRRPPDEKASVLGGALNTALLLSVLQVQPLSLDVTFWLLLGVGAVEIGVARLPVVRSRRMSFTMLTVAGAAVAIAAVPLRFAPEHVTPVWLVQAALLTAAGIVTAEPVYRRIGTAALVVTTAQFLFFPFAEVARSRFHGAAAAPEWILGAVCLALVAALYAEPLWLLRRWNALYGHAADRVVSEALGYAGAALALLAGWLWFPGAGTAVFWGGVSLALAIGGRLLHDEALALQAALAGAGAFGRVLAADLPSSGTAWGAIRWRAVTVPATAAIFYATARVSQVRTLVGQNLCRVCGTWAGTVVLAVLVWYELEPAPVALVWAVFAFLLALLGRRFDAPQLTYQANALVAVAIGRLIVVNLPSDESALSDPLSVSWRVATTTVIVAILYLLSRWNAARHLDDAPAYAIAPTWIAAALLVVVSWLELLEPVVATAWSALALVLAAFGHLRRDPQLTAQANVIALIALCRFLAVDLSSGAVIVGTPLRVTWRAANGIGLTLLLEALSWWNGARHLRAPRAAAVVPRIAATVLLMLLAVSELERGAVIVAWAAVGFALIAGRRVTGLADLAIQANAVAIACAVRAVTVSLPGTGVAFHLPLALSWRVIGTAAAIALLYTLFRTNRAGDLEFAVASHPGRSRMEAYLVAPCWIGTALLTLLPWYELRPASVAIAWAVSALLLLEIGARLQSRDLILQAALLLATVFARVLVVNMNIDDGTLLGPRVWTVVPIVAALLYSYFRAGEIPAAGFPLERVAPAFAWMALACTAALLRFHLPADAVVGGWSALVLVLTGVAVWSGRRVFLHVGLALALAVLVRGALHNLYERSYFPSPGAFDRWIWLGGAAVLLLMSLPFAFRLRSLEPADGQVRRRVTSWLDRRPEQFLFFVPLLLVTALIGTEMGSGMLTVGWGLEAVTVFVVAVWVGERTYRLAGVSLLLLCVAKVFVLDFWALSLRDKALTGIVMGLALIAVSLLYTRKKETILKYL